MFGAEEANSLSEIAKEFWPVAKAGVVAVVVVTLLTLVPLLGSFVANSPGLQSFLEGVIIFRIFAGDVLADLIRGAELKHSLYPGLWESFFYLVIAAVLVRVLYFGGAGIALWLGKDRNEEWADSIAMFLAPSLSVLGGLLPLFMYVQHVRLILLRSAGG